MSKVEAHIKKMVDEDLVRIVQEGEDRFDAAYRQIYDRHSKWVYNKCIQFVGADYAADLTQEIFVKVFLNLKKFQHGSKFSTWLYTITYRACLDAVEKNKKTLDAKTKYLLDMNVDTDVESWADVRVDETLMNLRHEAIEKILDLVEPMYKTVLLMKYQDEMKLSEMAKTLNTTEGSVKMRLRRAKDSVLKIYEQMKHDEESI